VRDFRQLQVWEKAHHLTLSVYRATESFPAAELYGLTSQLRRSALSIPSNIAEGCGRPTRPEFVRFLHIAAAPASEAEYQLLLARDLGYVAPDPYEFLAAAVREIKMMLTALARNAPAQ